MVEAGTMSGPCVTCGARLYRLGGMGPDFCPSCVIVHGVFWDRSELEATEEERRVLFEEMRGVVAAYPSERFESGPSYRIRIQEIFMTRRAGRPIPPKLLEPLPDQVVNNIKRNGFDVMRAILAYRPPSPVTAHRGMMVPKSRADDDRDKNVRRSEPLKKAKLRL